MTNTLCISVARVSLLALFFITLSSSRAGAEQGEVGCQDVIDVDRFRYLRQLKLDLHGVVPSEQELTSLISKSDVNDADIDALLASDDFENFVRRYHSDLLWPTVAGGELVNPAIALLLPASIYELDGNADRLFLIYVGIYRRGGLVPCKDEPAQFDDNGDPITELMPDGTTREGYVMVTPYWAPGTEVRVCAFEAQMALTSLDGQDCAKGEGMLSGTCGCGPQLEHCLSFPAAAEIQQSLQEQLLRMVLKPIREGRSYYDLLFDKTEELNGSLVHYYRHLVPMAVDPIILVPPVPAYKLPANVTYSDTQWNEYERGAEHSGVLTSLAYLMRFQTPRARANRFYDAFLCAPFQAPAVALPSPSDPCSNEPNLRERCGCKMCHASLEPAAAYWARFADAGALYLDELFFPKFSEKCAACAAHPAIPCDFVCQRFYMTEPGHPKEEKWVGTLMSLVFSSDAEAESAASGPSALVTQTIGDGRLPRCTVHKLFERFIRRPMTTAERTSLEGTLISAFDESGYSFKALVKALVTHPVYRRMAR